MTRSAGSSTASRRNFRNDHFLELANSLTLHAVDEHAPRFPTVDPSPFEHVPWRIVLPRSGIGRWEDLVAHAADGLEAPHSAKGSVAGKCLGQPGEGQIRNCGHLRSSIRRVVSVVMIGELVALGAAAGRCRGGPAVLSSCDDSPGGTDSNLRAERFAKPTVRSCQCGASDFYANFRRVQPTDLAPTVASLNGL